MSPPSRDCLRGLAVASLVPGTARHTVLYMSCHLSPPTWASGIQCLLGPKSQRAAGRADTEQRHLCITVPCWPHWLGHRVGGGAGGSGCNACRTVAALPQLSPRVSAPPVCSAALWHSALLSCPSPPTSTCHSLRKPARDKAKRCGPPASLSPTPAGEEVPRT